MRWLLYDVKKMEGGLLLCFARESIGRFIRIENRTEAEKWARKLKCVKKDFTSKIGQWFNLKKGLDAK